MSSASDRVVEPGQPISAGDIIPGDVIGHQTPTGDTRTTVLVSAATVETTVTLNLSGTRVDAAGAGKAVSKRLPCDSEGKYAGKLVFLKHLDMDIPTF